MKYLKMLGLAVVAAAALSALIGAGTASATEICAATENPCSSANMYGVGTKVEGKLVAGTEAVLTGTINDNCKESAYEGEGENTGGPTETAKVKTKALTFGNCTCPATVNVLPNLEIHTDQPEESGIDNGTVTTSTFTATIKCGIVTCRFHSNSLTAGLTIDGGNPAKLTATNVVLPLDAGSSEGLCGASGTWNAKYEITTPKPLWVI